MFSTLKFKFPCANLQALRCFPGKVAPVSDGADYHTDPVKDIRRRNELSALGWTIYPIGKQTMYNPENMYRFGLSMRKTLKLRQRLPRNWALKYEALRKSIGLTV